MNLTPTAIKAIESILSKGDRAEVIPTKEWAKVIKVVRKEVILWIIYNSYKKRLRKKYRQQGYTLLVWRLLHNQISRCC